MRRSTWDLLDVLERPADWMEFGACLGHDPELFFPNGTKGPALRQARIARSVCSTCQVRTDCAEWRQETGAVGVWAAEYYDDHGRRVDLDQPDPIEPDPDDKRLVGASEVARMAGTTHAAVRGWVRRGRLKPAIVTPSGCGKFLVSDVAAYLDSRQRKPYSRKVAAHA